MPKAKPLPTTVSREAGKQTLVICLLLTLSIAAVYWPVVRNGFVNFDDPDYVTGNPRVQAGLVPQSLVWAFTGVHSSNWHPLTWISHMLDMELYGNKPAGHHVTSVVFHAINSVLLFLLLRHLTGRQWASAFVAALFGLHPMHVESVAWISERKDVLSGCLGILALAAYVAYARARGIAGGAGSRRALGYYALTFFLLALGLLAKPMLVTWPFVMLLLDFWPLQRVVLAGTSVPPVPRGSAVRRSSPVALLIEKLPFFVLAALSCLVTFVAQRASGAMVSFTHSPFEARLANSIGAYGWYVVKLLWPVNLCAFYPHARLGWDSEVVLGSAALVGAITVAAVVAVRKRPFLLVGWLFFLGTLVPVIGLVQVGKQGWADRYTYLPYIGLFTILAWGAGELKTRWPRFGQVAWVAAGLGLAACGFISFRQVGYWRDTKTLFSRALEVTESNFVAHSVIATCLLEEGKTSEALEQCQESLRIAPDYSEAYNTLGNIYLKQEKYDEAIASYRKAADCDATYGDPYYGMAMTYARQGKHADAETAARESLRLAPMHLPAAFALATALHNQGKLEEAGGYYRRILALNPNLFAAQRFLGNVLVAEGKSGEAIPHFLAALKLRPNDADTHTVLGLALAQEQRPDDARTQFLEAVRLQPTNSAAHYHLAILAESRKQAREAIQFYQQVLRLQPEWADALNNLAWLLAANRDAGLRNGPEAVTLAERACKLTEYKHPLFVGTLAAAYAEAGRFEDAVTTGEKARALALAAGEPEIARRNQEFVELYRAGKAFHEAE